MAILPLVIAPDPRLKQMSQPVAEINDDLRKLMRDMLETMYHENGAGLAAVQVGVLKRILIIDVADEGKQEPIYMVNPEVIFSSKEMSMKNEGCLSFPDQRLEVERPAYVKVRFLDYDGHPQEIEAEGWKATAVQHEIDHLNGVVFIDYSSKIKKDIFMRRAQKIKKIIISNSTP